MRAFSLVELSIVLVILGLLTGGILAGQSLIRAAELRTVTTDYQRYVTASQTFRDKYMALPGDMTNATRFWGYVSGITSCTNRSGTSVTSPGTCDGNGDGRITGAATDNATGEELQAWRQLALAGLVEGSYSGVVVDVSSMSSYDVPVGRLGQTRWRYRDFGDLTGTVTGTLTSTFALVYNNALEISPVMSSVRPFKPAELWNMDTKIDDGAPASGKFIARSWQTCTTAASRTETSATYNLGDDTFVCQTILFRQ